MASAFEPRMAAKTRRLSIRPLEPADFSLWLEANQHRLPRQNVWDSEPRPAQELNRRRFLRLVRDQTKLSRLDRVYTLGLFLRKGPALVGTMNLMVVARGPVQLAWMGYSIYNHHWRNGYAREAGGAVLDLAFKELRIHRVEAGIRPKNHASIALARSLGMSRSARIRDSLWLEGEWVDIDVYGINAEARGVRMKPTVRLSPLD